MKHTRPFPGQPDGSVTNPVAVFDRTGMVYIIVGQPRPQDCTKETTLPVSRPTRRSLAAAAILSAGLLATAAPAWAGPFTADYVFGDSLSDRGNLADILRRTLTSPPFFHDSFTNGPTAVQVMASRLGLNADASLFPTAGQDIYGLGFAAGTNYAVAGATAAAANGVPGANLPNQIAAFLAKATGAADPNALYTVFIGGNDVRTAAHQGNPALVAAGVAAEVAGINTLYNAGARNFLVVNVPDVGVIPEFQIGFPTQVAAASAGSVAYNQALANGVASIAAADPAGTFKLFDLYNFNNGLLANPGQLGITDTTTPCYTSTGVNSITSATSAACGLIDPSTNQATNIGNLFYWDAIHPTAKVQNAIGNALYDFELAPTAVPEPASLLLLGAGLLGAATLRRRARQG